MPPSHSSLHESHPVNNQPMRSGFPHRAGLYRAGGSIFSLPWLSEMKVNGRRCDLGIELYPLPAPMAPRAAAYQRSVDWAGVFTRCGGAILTMIRDRHLEPDWSELCRYGIFLTRRWKHVAARCGRTSMALWLEYSSTNFLQKWQPPITIGSSSSSSFPFSFCFPAPEVSDPRQREQIRLPLLSLAVQHICDIFARWQLHQRGLAGRWGAALFGRFSLLVCSCLYLCVAGLGGVSPVLRCSYYLPGSLS